MQHLLSKGVASPLLNWIEVQNGHSRRNQIILGSQTGRRSLSVHMMSELAGRVRWKDSMALENSRSRGRWCRHWRLKNAPPEFARWLSLQNVVLSQLCSKVILNVSFLDKHDGSSFCRLRGRCSSGAKRAKLEARKEGPAISIRSSVIGRLNVIQAGY